MDEPEEAEKKANVMRNWLGVIARGRYNERAPGATPSPYGSAIDREVTAPPPSIQPSRVPLVPPSRKESRAKRTILGNANMLREGLPELPPDLPRTLPFTPATIEAKPARRTLPRHTPGGGMSGITDRSRGPVSRPMRRISPLSGVSWTRHPLATGLELHIGEHFDANQFDGRDMTELLAKIKALLDREQ